MKRFFATGFLILFSTTLFGQEGEVKLLNCPDQASTEERVEFEFRDYFEFPQTISTHTDAKKAYADSVGKCLYWAQGFDLYRQDEKNAAVGRSKLACNEEACTESGGVGCAPLYSLGTDLTLEEVTSNEDACVTVPGIVPFTLCHVRYCKFKATVSLSCGPCVACVENKNQPQFFQVGVQKQASQF